MIVSNLLIIRVFLLVKCLCYTRKKKAFESVTLFKNILPVFYFRFYLKFSQNIYWLIFFFLLKLCAKWFCHQLYSFLSIHFFLYTYQVIKLRIIFEFLFYNYIILIVFVQLTVLATITLQIKTDMICGRLYITSWMAYRNSKQLINAPLYEKSFSKYLIIFNSCHVLNMVVASAQWTDLFAFNFFFF